MRLHMRQKLLVHPLRGLAQRQFAQGRQVSRRKIVFQRPLRCLRDIDLAVMQPLDQVFRRQIDDLDIIGPVDDRIWNGFTHTDTGDLGDDVVQAFDMLDVERRIDVDAARQKLLHIHVAFRMPATGRIGVGQLIDENEAGAAGENGINIHFLEMAAPCSRSGVRAMTSNPSASACVSLRPCVSTTPMTTSTPSACLAWPDVSIS